MLYGNVFVSSSATKLLIRFSYIIFCSLCQGLIMLWDVDGGLPLVDKYLYSSDNHVVAGALLAVGIINCGVRNECDPVRS